MTTLEDSDAEVVEAHTFAVGDTIYALFGLQLPEPVVPQGLTAIEQELVRELLNGQTIADIARQRNRSHHTVSNQLRTIYKKLGVTGRQDLIARCLRTR